MRTATLRGRRAVLALLAALVLPAVPTAAQGVSAATRGPSVVVLTASGGQPAVLTARAQLREQPPRLELADVLDTERPHRVVRGSADPAPSSRQLLELSWSEAARAPPSESTST